MALGPLKAKFPPLPRFALEMYQGAPQRTITMLVVPDFSSVEIFGSQHQSQNLITNHHVIDHHESPL